MFHFNKKHLEDPSIPMWVIKTKGESYYVNHVECNVPWSTKETPDNNHTKGSIKVKDCHLVIDNENTAIISPLTPEIRDRLSGKKEPITLITSKGEQLKNALSNHKIAHGAIKNFYGGCGTSWYVFPVYNEADLMFLSLTVDGIRKLMPNEYYAVEYGNGKGTTITISEDMYDGDEDDY